MNTLPKQRLEQIIKTKVFTTYFDQHIESVRGTSDLWLFDFRKVMLRPEFLQDFVTLFFETYRQHYPFQVGGLEVASIPLISAIVTRSTQLGLPVNGFFIRKSRKKTGLLNKIEGTLTSDPIILIDDIINSGSTFIHQVETLNELSRASKQAYKVRDIFTILQFSPSSTYEYFIERQIMLTSLFKLSDFSDNLSQIALPLCKPPAINNRLIVWSWQATSPSYQFIQPKSGSSLYKNYLVTISDTGLVVCLESTTGSEVWRYQMPQGKKVLQCSAPYICNNAVYVGGLDGNIYKFDLVSGQCVWVNFDADCVQTDLIGDGKSMLFVIMEFGLFLKYTALSAISMKTGKIIWTRKISGKAVNGITFDQKHNLVFIGTSSGEIYAVQTQNNKILWQKQVDTACIANPLYIPETDSVIFSGIPVTNDTETAYIYHLQAKTGEEIYHMESLHGNYGQPTYYKGLLIIAGLDKTVRAFSLKGGLEQWSTTVDGRIFSSPRILDENGKAILYVGSNDGILYGINTIDGSIINRSFFSERITNKIEYDPISEIIFVTTYANQVYATRQRKILP